MKARFNGRCWLCSRPIHIGQEVHHTRNVGTAHSACQNAPQDRGPDGPEYMDAYDAWADGIAERYGSVRGWRWRQR